MLKNLSKKNIYILSGFIIIPLLFIFILIFIRGCSDDFSYVKYENKMINAAERYFDNKNSLPVTEGGVVEVSLDELVKSNYIDSSEKKLKDATCDGAVSVRKNANYYFYIPYLNCDSYKTTHIIDKLMNDVVDSKSGLYATNDGYIYKGAKVNNYVSFFDKKYRILSIDNNGIMKLVKIESEKSPVIWDNKYNTERNRISGKNDYSDSNIIDVLNENYKKLSDKQKKHMIGYSVCYGNRSYEHKDVDKVEECSKILDNQYISVMNTYDYAMASYDPECVNISSGSCRNYNYLYNTIDSTWLMNGNKDNSYEVYYYLSGSIELSNANGNRKYNHVIYLDGKELYSEGNGSIDKPYIIK